MRSVEGLVRKYTIGKRLYPESGDCRSYLISFLKQGGVSVSRLLYAPVFLSPTHGIGSHGAIGTAKNRVGRDEAGDSGPGVITGCAAIHLQEVFRLRRIHLPFDNGASEVP